MATDVPEFAGRAAPPAAAVAAVAAWGVLEMAFGAAHAGGENRLLSGDGPGTAAAAVLFSALAMVAVAVALVAFCARAKGVAFREMLRLSPRGARSPGEFVLFFAAGAAAAAPALSMLAVPCRMALEAAGFEPDSQPFIDAITSPDCPLAAKAAVAVSVVVLAPVSEEILYRAVMWQGLCAKWGRERASAVACALFFAALHLSAWAFVPLFVLALVLSAVYGRRTLGSAIALHAGFNAANCVFAILSAAD